MPLRNGPIETNNLIDETENVLSALLFLFILSDGSLLLGLVQVKFGDNLGNGKSYREANLIEKRSRMKIERLNPTYTNVVVEIPSSLVTNCRNPTYIH